MQTSGFARLATGGLLVLLAAGCTGPHEDVRITRCKNLTTTLLGPDTALEWLDIGQEINRPAYAVVTLHFRRGDSGAEESSACHFAYEALDETALTLAEPLEAYAVIPYDVRLNGESLSDAQRRRVSNEVDFKQLKDITDRLRAVN